MIFYRIILLAIKLCGFNCPASKDQRRRLSSFLHKRASEGERNKERVVYCLFGVFIVSHLPQKIKLLITLTNLTS